MFSEIQEAYNNPIKKQLDKYQSQQLKKITPERSGFDDVTIGSSIFDDSISYQSILKKPKTTETQTNIFYPVLFGVLMIVILDIFLNLGRTIESISARK